MKPVLFITMVIIIQGSDIDQIDEIIKGKKINSKKINSSKFCYKTVY